MAEIKFVADVMVGKLARWLRVLGFDVAYSNVLEDDEIVRLADSEHRIILTRDTGLVARCRDAQCLLIQSVDYKEQVQQVLHAFDLNQFTVFSRCLECNTLLEDIDKEAVFERVPPFVYLTKDRFATCPSCNRVYWHGTHADNMLKRIGVSS
jgi:uncharacterized protein with PIN domain